MPGLTLLHAARRSDTHERLDDLLEALRAQRFDERFDERFACDVLHRGEQHLLAAVRNDAYPITKIEADGYTLVLEGRIYGPTEAALRQELTALAPYLFRSDDTAQAQVRAWLLRTDGPFLLYACEEDTGAWALLNDALGRLPTYRQRAGGALCVSRSFPFLLRRPGAPPIDRLGLAQQLLRGFSFGARTLLEKTRRCPPSTLLRWNAAAQRTETYTLHTFNFEERRRAGYSTQENAEHLAGLFRAACERRVQAGAPSAATPVVTLSGGLDSRAVALALHQQGRAFEAVTFARDTALGRRDVEGAEKVARLFGIPQRTLPLDPPRGRHLQALLRAKGGLNLFDVAYVVDFLEKLRAYVRPGTDVWTGDGGGFILADRRPDVAPAHVGALARHVAQQSWLPLETVAHLTGLPQGRIVESIRQRLASYPEASMAQTYVHFFFYERLFRFSYEGEDRNRHYVRHVAPLYALPFFRAAMHCPDEQKADFALFRAFLLQLSPRALDVGYSNFLNAKMTPGGYRLYAALRGLVRRVPPLKRWLQTQLGRRRAVATEAPARACLRQQVARCPAVTGVLSPRALRAVQDGDLQQAQLDNLLTATSAIEWHATGRSTLTDFAEAAFG